MKKVMEIYGAQRLLDTHGTETVVLRQSGQIADVSLQATVGSIKTDDTPGRQGVQRTTTRNVLISTDPTSGTGGFATPSPSAHLIIQGEAWAIMKVTKQGAGIAKLSCQRRETTELSRNEYREDA